MEPKKWKRFGFGLWILLLTGVPSFATIEAQEITPNQRWIEQVDAGFVFPMSSAVSQSYNRGFGGDVLVGYRFNRDLSLSMDLGYYECDQKFSAPNGGAWVYVPLLAVARFNFGNGSVRPFLTLGIGGAENIASLTPAYSGTYAQMAFLLSPGAGILFVVAPDMAIYFQGRLDLDYTYSNGPFTTGPITDNPTIFIPMKAGISFFAL